MTSLSRRGCISLISSAGLVSLGGCSSIANTTTLEDIEGELSIIHTDINRNDYVIDIESTISSEIIDEFRDHTLRFKFYTENDVLVLKDSTDTRLSEDDEKIRIRERTDESLEEVSSVEVEIYASKALSLEFYEKSFDSVKFAPVGDGGGDFQR